jgi:hypothetical protein
VCLGSSQSGAQLSRIKQGVALFPDDSGGAHLAQAVTDMLGKVTGLTQGIRKVSGCETPGQGRRQKGAKVSRGDKQQLPCHFNKPTVIEVPPFALAAPTTVLPPDLFLLNEQNFQ